MLFTAGPRRRAFLVVGGGGNRRRNKYAERLAGRPPAYLVARDSSAGTGIYYKYIKRGSKKGP